MNRKFNIGDMVICKSSGVVGKTIKLYFPTASAEQTIFITNDGRNYHAPTSEWVRISERTVHDSEFTRQEIEREVKRKWDITRGSSAGSGAKPQSRRR